MNMICSEMTGYEPRRAGGRGAPRRVLPRYAGALWAGSLVAILAVSPAAAGQTETLKSTVEEQKSVAVTVYNSDLALVKDIRGIVLPKGVVNLRFEGVAAKIDPTSVYIRSLTAPGALAALEQNFEYDLISPAKLMEKYVGKTVELVTKKENDEEVSHEAKLIGIEGGYVYEMEGKIAVNPPGRVVLPELPEGLISRPTLVWMLKNDAKEHTVEASYLTGGMGWKSDYVVVLSKDESKVDVSGWVTIDNRSGATYENASIKLVAGDIHRATPTPRKMVMAEGAMDFARAAPQFEEEAFFEYHLYTLQRKSTIKDNQTKQIGLLEATGVSVDKSYVYEAPQGYWFAAMPGPDETTKIGVFLTLENSKKNGMGMPLPKGVVRVYKKDADESLQFVGEDAIDHTPEDEKVRVKIGDAFDVVGERAQTNYRVLSTGNLYESSYKITLRNHKDERIVVQVIETIPGDWTITEKSQEYVKETASRVRFDVPLEKKGSAELTYTVQVRY
jgi:hypothetical protein